MASTLHICAAKVKVYGKTASGYIPQGEDMPSKKVLWDLADANRFHFTSRENAQFSGSSASLSQW